MTNTTGKMGNAGELLNPWGDFYKKTFLNKKVSPQLHFERVIKKASTENSRFAIKIFPWQLRNMFGKHNYDFINECQKHHEVGFGLLTRADS